MAEKEDKEEGKGEERGKKKNGKKKEWSMRVSNSRPSRYQHDALPTELMDPHEGIVQVIEL